MAFNKQKALERAEKYAAKGQHDKAAREYRTVVDADPKDIRAWLMLADCLVRSGNAREAIDHYLQVARTYTTKKQPQKALAVFRQVLNLDPSRLDVLLAVAELNHVMGRAPDAVAAYEAVASQHMQAGRVRDALSAFQKAADVDPTSVSRRLRLAELYSREKMVDEAVAAFRQAGAALIEAERLSDYVRVAERLLYHKKDDAPTLRELSRVYLALGEPRRALMKLSELLQREKKDAAGLELLADTFEALGRKEKAASVLAEVARILVAAGPDEHGAELARVVRRGLAWAPEHSELLRLARDHGIDAEDDDLAVEVLEDDDAIELLDDEVEELEPDDIVLDDETEAGGAEEMEPAGEDGSAEISMTDAVLEDVREAQSGPSEAATEDEPSDLDKLLYEVRVYLKYKLFDHALEHLQPALEADPEHVGALSLRARTLRECERLDEAAADYVEIARIVAPSDPKLAMENLRAALEIVPGHEQAAQGLARLEAGDDTAAQPVAPGFDMADEAAFDDLSHEAAAGGDADAGHDEAPTLEPIEAALVDDDDDLSIDDDFAIEMTEERDSEEVVTQPIEVENRFGLSEAGPLPGDTARDLADGVPRFVEPEPGAGEPETVEDLTAQEAIPDEAITREFEPIGRAQEPSAPEPALEAEATAGEQAGEAEATASEHAGEAEATAGERGADEVEGPAGEGEGEVAEGEGAWPDIEDELAEIRFYDTQGLDDDVEFALADLERRFPGHPQVAALRAELAPSEAPPVEPEAAQPLVSFEDEDEDEDAYLAAIFSDEPAPSSPSRSASGAGARAEVEDADGRTCFDLGTAYREMGLVDQAVEQFEIAARDPEWEARSRVMLGLLRLHQGNPEGAQGEFERAIEVAREASEVDEARYELAGIFEQLGRTEEAVAQLAQVTPGYRDREAKLAALQGE